MEPTINLLWQLAKHFVKDPPCIDLEKTTKDSAHLLSLMLRSFCVVI